MVSQRNHYKPRRLTARSKGNMDQNPQKNLPPVSNNYGSQYNWFSPLRDIQHDTFNPTPASHPEDNPIPSIDPELFTERVPNTSSRTDTSTYTGYQTQYHWPNPLRDIQPGIFNPEPTPNPEDNPIFGPRTIHREGHSFLGKDGTVNPCQLSTSGQSGF